VVRLDPGEIREVAMEIPNDDLAIYDDQGRPRALTGTYQIQLGVSSVDVRLNAEVEIS
jgi:Fibronectin type III-like domain